ncbi:MAG: hypothetical protein WAK91_14460 [Candidatus Acidiferrales bacterium]|jgi:hypothetical protein
MTIPPNVRGKFYTLRALALALGAFAAVVFLLRPNGFGLRPLALLGIFVGLWLIRRSNASVWKARGQVVGMRSPANSAGRVEPLAWILTAASLVACGATYFLMYLDALHGGKEGWPAYAFGAAALVFAAASGYVAMKLFQ